MLKLNNLSPAAGSHKNNKRVGRGQGTGQGGTAGRGHKGARARSGYSMKSGFEGGQMPLHRRLPKGGFTNIFKREFAIINLKDLERFDNGTEITKEILFKSGLIKGLDEDVKVLASGEITKSLVLHVDKISGNARQKIEAVGGSVKE